MALKNVNAIGQKIYLFVFAALVVFLTATTTQAGFEWVPTNSENPAAEQPPAADITAAEESDVFTPAPEVQSESLQPQPLSEQQDLTEPPATSSTVQNLADQAPQQEAPAPATAPVQQEQQAAAAAEEPQKMKVLIPGQGVQTQPTQEEPQVLIPAETANTNAEPPVAPPPTFNKVIMPEDAPESAMNNTPGSQKILVAPPADQQSLPAVDGQPYSAQASAPAQQEQAAPVAPPVAPITFAEAVGFGSDMPLAIALQQVVPAEYAFSFAPNVNAGTRVSWNGGRPWNEVVSEMVASLGLRADIKGRVVHISKADAPIAEKSAAAEMPEIIPAPGDNPIELTPAPVRSNTSSRARITDPGETPASQPGESVSRINTIENSSAEAPQDIAPASGGDASQEPAPAVEVIENPAAAENATEAAPAEEDTAAEAAPQEPESIAAEADKGFQARRGDSLKDTLAAWSSEAGVELLWQSSHDYTISVDIATDSNFENAVQTVFANALTEETKPSLVFLNDSQTQEIKAVMVKEESASSEKG